MADLRLRELERRWRQTDSVEDEAVFLRERLRVGDLTEERLRLAAWLGHAAAERLTELRFEPRPRARDALAGLTKAPAALQGALARWGDGLMAFGRDVALRAALADARRCLTAIAADLKQDGRRGRAAEVPRTWARVLTEAVDRATRFVLDPTDGHREDAREALRRRTDGRFINWILAGGPTRTTLRVWQDLSSAAWVLGLGVDEQPIEDWWHWSRPDDGTDQAARYRAIRGAMTAEVLPWALGWRDPLRELPARALGALVDAVDSLEVASPCAAVWEDMPAVDERGLVRACGACRHRVYDVSALPRAEVEALLRDHEGERLCLRFYRREDGRVVTRDCPVGLDARVQDAVERPRRPMMGIRIAPRSSS